MPLSPRDLREAVAGVYDAVARSGSRPPQGLGFATGRDLAVALGYPPEPLADLPSAALAAFVGAGALAEAVDGRPGEVVLDLGCGAGVDGLLLAARGYRVLALDASLPMLRLAGRAPRRLAVRGALPDLPVRDACARWALLNGVANLVPDRTRLLAEIHRALAPGGTLVVADLLQTGPIPSEVRDLPEAWAWCVAGATTGDQWRRDLADAGFEAVELSVGEEFPPLARALIAARRAPGGEAGRRP